MNWCLPSRRIIIILQDHPTALLRRDRTLLIARYLGPCGVLAEQLRRRRPECSDLLAVGERKLGGERE